ncbi:sugar-binding domain-containing protein [Mangrovibacterium marinum]|uniref:Beta-galactosidase n=1 Tax=Mangrovibacterium marinum TaxID=1639118 RepID=A0A2T5BYX7_9BACT|nr:sugar-binding domain-containing protein [Mangrovibacterium marinum]PTN07455.1 beta-galactosidase [Mangrovibacterium marinum]
MKKLIPITLLFFAVSLGSVLANNLKDTIDNYQENDVTVTQDHRLLTGRRLLFDNDWKFKLGHFPGAGAKRFADEKTWREVDLPHDWSIEGLIKQENSTGYDGGFFPAGEGWYRKTFHVPSDWGSKRVSIYFEGVYMNSKVYVNGNLVGTHPYGYTSFRYDLTPYLYFGKRNTIAVYVNNSEQENCRWYSGSGIYRHVWLELTNRVHIDQWGVSITTPEVSQKAATIQVKSLIKNETDTIQFITVLTKIVDKNKINVSTGQLNLQIEAQSQREVVQNFIVKKPCLWTPDTPNLYNAEVDVLMGDEVIDQTDNKFGIRSIKYSVENGFELNGTKLLLNGGCVHHDNGCLGAKAYDRAEVRKVELLKGAGFNAVRTSHNPPSEAFLNACDSLGLLVLEEAFDGWKNPKTPYDYSMYFDDWAQQDLESMVLRDKNHPSVIMWSIGNEVFETIWLDPGSVERIEKLANIVRQLDPSRPVTCAITTWGKEWNLFDSSFKPLDIGGYNYQLHNAISDHKRVPERIILGTESYPKEAFKMWNLVKNNNYIIGDFVWTAMDYLGESGIGRYYYYPQEKGGEHGAKNSFPFHGGYSGDIDMTGWRKPISHYRNILYNDTEKLYMAVREPNPIDGEIRLTDWAVWPAWESWTWPRHEGDSLEVDVYSKCTGVQLYLNNKLIGERKMSLDNEYKTTFTVPYSPGELKAIGIDGEKHYEQVLQTSGEATSIRLTADRSTILANNQDLSFVRVEVTDKFGNIQPNANNQLTFNVEGPGIIAGTDNANLRDVTPYFSETRKVWHGKALVVIKSTGNPGQIILKASSPGLQDVSLIINSQ